MRVILFKLKKIRETFMSRVITLISIMIFIVACGGGGSSSPSSAPGSPGSSGAAQGYQVQEKIQAVD